MSFDKKTIKTYDARASDYASATKNLGEYDQLCAFTKAMPKNARVLDLGCGPGLYASYFGANGISVDAIDASAEMVKLAAQYPNVTARQASFDDITGDQIYDGIWANFSLLHAPRTDFPRHLTALYRALKTGGVFHIGMKLGEGANRDTMDRFYTYYTKDDLLTHLTNAGFTVDDTYQTSGHGFDGTASDFILVSAHA